MSGLLCFWLQSSWPGWTRGDFSKTPEVSLLGFFLFTVDRRQILPEVVQIHFFRAV
jgi:hypothetical protein